MKLRLKIDGRLVAHCPVDIGSDLGHLYVFHEYGYWSLLTVVARDDGGGRIGPEGGTAWVTVECYTSLAGLASAVHRHSGPDAWLALLDVGDHEFERLSSRTRRPD